MNSVMFKLVLEKAEEPESKLPTSTGVMYLFHCFMLFFNIPSLGVGFTSAPNTVPPIQKLTGKFSTILKGNR